MMSVKHWVENCLKRSQEETAQDSGREQPSGTRRALFSQGLGDKSLCFAGASQHFTLINNKQDVFSSSVGQQIEMCLCYQPGRHNREAEI